MMVKENRGGDLAIVGAKLLTNTNDHADATALLVRAGRIERMGSDSEIRSAAETAGVEVRDFAGAVVTPGLYDSHTHPLMGAETADWVDLAGKGSLDDVRAALAEEAERLPEEGWVIAWNLEYEPFAETGIHGSLFEEAVGGRACVIRFYDGHTSVANSAALAAAGISGAREFEDASEIVVDSEGMPTGELREASAGQLVFGATPPVPHEIMREGIRNTLEQLAAVGLTGGAIQGGFESDFEMLDELEARGELVQRFVLHQWHAVHDDDAAVQRRIELKDRRGRLWKGGAIKLFSDGVIDTGTGWLHTEDTCGGGRTSFWPDWSRYGEVVKAYHDAGMFISTHAVGDYAVSRVLDVYTELPKREGPAHTIEHLEVLSDADVEQLKGTGVTASMQPLHMQWRRNDGSDNWTTRLGPGRDETGYRVRSLLETGTRVVLGSDWPVADFDPRVGMAWARGRHTPGDPNARVFEPQERLTGEEALLAYTLWPAQARGQEDQGALAPGMLADFTVWGEDPTQVDPDALIAVPIVATIVDGVVVHG